MPLDVSESRFNGPMTQPVSSTDPSIPNVSLAEAAPAENASHSPAPSNLAAFLGSLTEEQMAKRLGEVEEEARAIRLILKMIRARDRRKQRESTRNGGQPSPE